MCAEGDARSAACMKARRLARPVISSVRASFETASMRDDFMTALKGRQCRVQSGTMTKRQDDGGAHGLMMDMRLIVFGCEPGHVSLQRSPTAITSMIRLVVTMIRFAANSRSRRYVADFGSQISLIFIHLSPEHTPRCMLEYRFPRSVPNLIEQVEFLSVFLSRLVADRP